MGKYTNKFYLLISFCLLFNLSFSQTFSLSDFKKLLDKNSLQIIDNKANFESMLMQSKSELSYKAPYIETELNTTRHTNGTTTSASVEFSSFLIFTPRLPWVSKMLKESINLTSLQYAKTHSLLSNLNFIGAKRTYLTYMQVKQKYMYYLQRETNFLTLLQNANKRLEAGSISNKDYVSFQSAYFDSNLANIKIKNELIQLQKTLFMSLGLSNQEYNISLDSTNDKNDITIVWLDFSYLNIDKKTLDDSLNNSLYNEIISLEASNYQSLAKYNARNLFDTLELGAGVNRNAIEYSPNLRVSIPLGITGKNQKLKAKYMALYSGALAKNEITKKNILIKAKAYLKELEMKEKYMKIAQENIQSKKELARLSKLAYEAQQITLFEYISAENAFADSQISFIDSKIEYINILSNLEETIGRSFTEIKE